MLSTREEALVFEHRIKGWSREERGLDARWIGMKCQDWRNTFLDRLRVNGVPFRIRMMIWTVCPGLSDRMVLNLSHKNIPTKGLSTHSVLPEPVGKEACRRKPVEGRYHQIQSPFFKNFPGKYRNELPRVHSQMRRQKLLHRPQITWNSSLAQHQQRQFKRCYTATRLPVELSVQSVLFHQRRGFGIRAPDYGAGAGRRKRP